MKRLAVVWILALGILLYMVYYVKTESTNFHGIADAREIVINNENSVQIKKIHVVAGQIIKTGDTILELNRPDLDMKILEITNELQKLTAQKVMNSDFIMAQINQLIAEREKKANEIESEISELKTQHSINVSLASELKSVKTSLQKNSDGTLSSVDIKIQNLEKLLKSTTEEFDVRIRELRKSPRNAIQSQIDNYTEQLNLLQQEQKKLLLSSPIDGIVGSVNFKEGENASAFAALVTVHPKAPAYIHGYIHENVYNNITIGQQVTVSSITSSKEKVQGTIVGVGARIVACPTRLWKRPDIEAWGREVQVKIPENNPFLLGEKVLITAEENIYEKK